MPNTRIYPQLTTDQLNAAIDQAFAAVDPVGLQEDIEYFQDKIASAFSLPRRFLGFTDEELAANSEAQQYQISSRTERERRAERFMQRTESFRALLPQPLPHPYPTHRLFYLIPNISTREKPLSGGFAFKLKPLNFGLSNVFL